MLIIWCSGLKMRAKRLESHLECSWALLFGTEELRLTNLISKQSKRRLNLGISRSFMDFKVAWHISEDSSQILQDVAIPLATL